MRSASPPTSAVRHLNEIICFTVTVILLVFVWQSESTNMCYRAKTCFHNGVEKCGVDEEGNLRRFIDSCDILEYNCLYDADYTKSRTSRCSNLPPLEIDENT